jgi:hypothetical protein
MTAAHEPAALYWDADTEHCPHSRPANDASDDAWLAWDEKHQAYDDGWLCLEAPAGMGCPPCSEEAEGTVLFAHCRRRPAV